MKIFQETKVKFKNAIQSVLDEKSSYEIDEAALPAYAHRNLFIDYIFWQRIKIAYKYGLTYKNRKVLDFGCGSGLLSYALAKNGVSIVANDVEFSPLNLLKEKINFPEEIEFIEGNLLTTNIGEKSFDLIIALDVLEHISNLDEYILLFKKLLKKNGVIIVSGPTENVLYKIGRRMAGEKFTGDYHVNNIGNIRMQFSKHLRTKMIKKIIWPFTLFEIFIAIE